MSWNVLVCITAIKISKFMCMCVYTVYVLIMYVCMCVYTVYVLIMYKFQELSFALARK